MKDLDSLFFRDEDSEDGSGYCCFGYDNLRRFAETSISTRFFSGGFGTTFWLETQDKHGLHYCGDWVC